MVGSTDYKYQTMDQLVQDLKNWINFSEKFLTECEIKIQKLTNEDKRQVQDLNLLIQSTPMALKTNISEISTIVSDITNGQIKDRTVNLLESIHEKAREQHSWFLKAKNSVTEEYFDNKFYNSIMCQLY